MAQNDDKTKRVGRTGLSSGMLAALLALIALGVYGGFILSNF